MKILSSFLVLAMLCGFFATAGCQNTASGFHQDWKNNMQKAADETNKL